MAITHTPADNVAKADFKAACEQAKKNADYTGSTWHVVLLNNNDYGPGPAYRVIDWMDLADSIRRPEVVYTTPEGK